MKPKGRILAMAAAPMLMAGMLLAGSSGFKAAAATSTLNKLSDKIDFTGTFVLGGSHFAIYSTSCTLHDGGKGKAIPCHLGGAGSLDLAATPVTATSDVTITGPDGTITFHQSAAAGCATGTGIEIVPGHSAPVPVRVEGLSQNSPVTATQFAVSGTISVYEEGGGSRGISCVPD